MNTVQFEDDYIVLNKEVKINFSDIKKLFMIEKIKLAQLFVEIWKDSHLKYRLSRLIY